MDIPKDIKVAISFLEDAKEEIEKQSEEDSEIPWALKASAIVQYHIAPAKAALEKAASAGNDVSVVLAEAFCLEGMIARTVYQQSIGQERERWLQMSTLALRSSIDCCPLPGTQFALGAVYADAGRWEESITMLAEAESAGDSETSLEASKMIGRVECMRASDDPEKRAQLKKLETTVEKLEKGPCFVATAVYGTPLAAEVRILRRFRDTVLARSYQGQGLIRVYERHGPALASLIADRPALRGLVRYLVLQPAVLIAHRALSWFTDKQ
jgi:hypothetical protein